MKLPHQGGWGSASIACVYAACVYAAGAWAGALGIDLQGHSGARWRRNNRWANFRAALTEGMSRLSIHYCELWRTLTARRSILPP